MKYRLLLDIEVYDWLAGMPQRFRREFRALLDRIVEAPAAHTDYHETDETGRLLNVHLYRGFAIKYWDDFADRHIKILMIVPADY